MRCAACGAENRPQARYCISCGAALTLAAPVASIASATVMPAAVAPAAPLTSEPTVDPNGATHASTLPLEVPHAAQEGGGGQMWRLLTSEPTGLLQAVLALVVGAVLSGLLWAPATGMAGTIATWKPFTFTYDNCARFGHSPAGTRCAILNGVTGFIPPIVLALLIFALRGTFGRLSRLVAPRLPESGRFLLLPLVATAMFTLSWAAARRLRPDQAGLLPQIFFPALVGVFAFAVVRWGQPLLQLLDRLVGQRDRIRMPVRALIAAAVPFAFALVATPQQRVGVVPPDLARFEHITVLVGMVAGFVMLAPRIGRRTPVEAQGEDDFAEDVSEQDAQSPAAVRG